MILEIGPRLESHLPGFSAIHARPTTWVTDIAPNKGHDILLGRGMVNRGTYGRCSGSTELDRHEWIKDDSL